MLNVERWNELRAMDRDELAALAKSLGLNVVSCVAIMAEENRRKDPEWTKRLDEYFR